MRRIALLLAVVLTACARPGSSTGPIDHPTGDGLVLRVAHSGGFAGPAFDYLNFPSFSLMGDGRVILPGAQAAIYPGPALPSVNERRLAEAGIQAVLKELSATRLFDASATFNGARACVMDASDTVFTLHEGGREVVLKVYGLGTVDSTNGCPGFSSDERAMHRTLLELLQRLATLEQWLPASAWTEAAWHSYLPAAIRLFVRNADADPPDSSGIGNQLLDWPGASDPTTFGDPTSDGTIRCGVVSGQEAEDWYAALSGANQLTRFVTGGHRYQVTVRFLLPDEPGECPTLPG